MNDFIEIYDNSVSQEVCDELVEWFDLCSEKNFTEHTMSFPDGGKQIIHRSDESIIFPNQPPVFSHSLSNEVCGAVWNVLNKCYNEYAAKYDLNNLNLSCYNFKLHKVKKGQGYHLWHYETAVPHGECRVLAWMSYLKVPEEGGETEFLYQSKRIEPVIGRTLIWPAGFTHLHRGNPPLKGEKYYITGWFEKGE